MHLTRTARLAGEAFAFAEPEADAFRSGASPRGPPWIFLAVAALTGLYLGF